MKMILQGSIRLCVPLMASFLLFQMGSVYLSVFADFEMNSQQSKLSHSSLTSSYKSSDKVLQNSAIIIQEYASLNSDILLEMKDEATTSNNQVDKHQILYNDEMEIETTSKVVSKEELSRLEKKFLHLFGMDNVPKSKGKRKKVIPKKLLELFEKQISSDYPTTDLHLPGKLTRSANTVRAFDPDGSSSLDQIIKLKFNLTSIPPTEVVTGAELRVPFTISKTKENSISSPALPKTPTFVRVLSIDIVKPSKNTEKLDKSSKNVHAITYPTDSKLVNLTNRKYPNFWLTFDILPAVTRWMKNHTKFNHGVNLELVGLHGFPYHEDKDREFNIHVKQNLDIQPMLFIYSDDGHNSKSRGKRAAKQFRNRKNRSTQHLHNQRRRKSHRHKNRRRNLCSKRPMFVDFTDVGWNDWIVAPPGYQAFYCTGECPFPMAEHLNATNHAVIQALINSMNPALVPPPCCVPNKYSSLSLLYTDSSDRIVLKNYNEMIVDSCGCS